MDQNSELHEVLQVLHQTQNPDGNVQRMVNQRVSELSQHPRFFQYLMAVLSEHRDENEAIRSVAVIITKNHVRAYPSSLPQDILAGVRQASLQALSDPSRLIRVTSSTLVATIAASYSVSTWPDLLRTLIDMVNSDNQHALHGGFSALQKICEDCHEELSEPGSAEVLNVLVQTFVRFFLHQNPEIRALALASCNHFVLDKPQGFMVNVTAFLSALFQLAGDSDSKVRCRVCQALTNVLDARIDEIVPDIVPEMPNIVEFMIMATSDEDEEVAQEACEFWLIAGETDIADKLLRPVLPKLLPVLLRRMAYSEMDLMMMGANLEDDAHIEDRPEDIRPRFAQSRTRVDDDEDGDEDADDSTEWNLRKCAAAALDLLSNVFGNDVLPILLPLFHTMLQDNNWLVKESAILAIGAIAEGCIEGMEQHLNEVIPYLLTCLSDAKSLVRAITCWALSRYATWIVESQELFVPLLEQLLNRMLDNSKRVQEAACSAFATLEEEAGVKMVPYLPYVLNTLVAAFGKYQHKNLLILYDAIGTLADSIGAHLNKPEYVEKLMPPLFERWHALADDDKDLFPLLECLSSVATSLRAGFLPYANIVFQRCVRLTEQSIHAQAIYMQDKAHYEPPDKDFVVVALDLLSAMAESIEGSIESLVANSNLLQMLHICMQDEEQEVRQSAFALLGDLTKSAFPHVEPHAEKFIPILAANLDRKTAHVPVSNNATWALGELAVQIGGRLKPFLGIILDQLIFVANAQTIPRALRENTCVTLGRLGLGCADAVAPRLPEILPNWCLSLRTLKDTNEKASSFHGMCNMMSLNPEAALPALVFFCDTFNAWENAPPDVMDVVKQLLHNFKTMLGPGGWQEYFGRYPEPLRLSLQEKFQL